MAGPENRRRWDACGIADGADDSKRSYRSGIRCRLTDCEIQMQWALGTVVADEEAVVGVV
jgi:hypothetical protein